MTNVRDSECLAVFYCTIPSADPTVDSSLWSDEMQTSDVLARILQSEFRIVLRPGW
jgi:hypothetical protein